MKLKYGCPYWGSENTPPSQFFKNINEAGYEGVELFLQEHQPDLPAFIQEIDRIRKSNPDFFLVALQLTFPVMETVEEHISRMERNLEFLKTLSPDFINSHTGRDFYSFDDNCRIIEASMNFAARNKVRIIHETHRGRFSFHTATLIPYLEKFPELELNGDLSHFCTVSESMLEDQDDLLQKIFPHIAHIHARIGYEQGPQVSDPAAPEWSGHLEKFMGWWQQILEARKERGDQVFTISPEFGPVPYMPVKPYSQTPLSDQWENNLFMLKEWKKRYQNH